MKIYKKYGFGSILLLGLFSIVLSGCEFGSINDSSPSSVASNNVSTSQPTSVSQSTSVKDTTSISNSTSIKDSTSTSLSIEDKDGTISIYAMNDFHGSVVESGYELGLLKQGTFFKQKGSEDNTLIINSGDMFQGAIESNYNYGEFLTYAMNNIEFDCFTLGNHEFDWGDEYIEINRELKDPTTNYQTPFLSANIYNYDMSTKTTHDRATNLGDEYVIRDLENGLRVGIIGVIGSDQITSITSQFVDMYDFVNPVNIVKTLSDELRTEKGCDVIIVDAHASISQIGYSISQVSSVSNKRYADAVLCAHSHEYEAEKVNGVPFVQAASNGKSYAEIQLSVEDGNVNCEVYSNHEGDVGAISRISNYDADLLSLYNHYKGESDVVGKEVIGTLTGTLYTGAPNALGNLVSKAMAEEALAQGFNIDYAVTNYSRATLDSGTITYANLYKSLPFDNEMYIVSVLGSDLRTQAGYDSNFVYRVNSESLRDNQRYTIVVLDYLAFHRNASRKYNYYPSLEYIGKLSKTGVDLYNYRDVAAEYFRKNRTINAANYSSYSSEFQVI